MAEAKTIKEDAAEHGKWPLHYAAEASASLEVMTLLLKADSKAAAAADKARAAARPLYAARALPRDTLRRRRGLARSLLPLRAAASLRADATPCAAPRRTRSCRCTTPP